MKPKKLTVRELKQQLEQSSKTDLINEIADLYSKIALVKDYYQNKLAPENEATLADKYKAIIKREFFPERGFGKLRLSEAKRAISDYQQVGRNPTTLIDLILFYVEMGAAFINEYGDIKESFYESGENMFEKAATLIVNHNLQATFQLRCLELVRTTNGAGYGFHDTLSETYNEFFP